MPNRSLSAVIFASITSVSPGMIGRRKRTPSIPPKKKSGFVPSSTRGGASTNRPESFSVFFSGGGGRVLVAGTRHKDETQDYEVWESSEHYFEIGRALLYVIPGRELRS